ncbi:MAG: SMC-Scp complex subunit ScpB [Alphaproteobacteria bacterium]
MTETARHRRVIEALLFAAPEPLDEAAIQSRLPEGVGARDVLDALARDYAERGVNLVEVAGKWQFRTAPDIAPLLRLEIEVRRKPSRAALETLAIIAYHQPVTRAEIEDIRGVSVSKGTLDLLLEAGWIRPRGHREAPGKPVLWVTSEGFLEHFGLGALDDLPGVAELKASGLLEGLALPPSLEAVAEDGDDEPEDEQDSEPVRRDEAG